MGLSIDDSTFVREALAEFIEVHKEELGDKTEEAVNLVRLLYEGNNTDTKNKFALIRKFIDETSCFSFAGIFSRDPELSEGLKNLYFFDLVEKVRFSKMQQESLRDTSTYNRHIEKSLTEMKNALAVLFELGSEYTEVQSVLEKYFEFTRHVNTSKAWLEFDSLKKYPVFQKFTNTL